MHPDLIFDHKYFCVPVPEASAAIKSEATKMMMAAREALEEGRWSDAEMVTRSALDAATGPEQLLGQAVLAHIQAARGETGQLDQLRMLADREGSMYAQMALARLLVVKRQFDEAERRISAVMEAGGSPHATITAALLADLRKKPTTAGLQELLGSAGCCALAPLPTSCLWPYMPGTGVCWWRPTGDASGCWVPVFDGSPYGTSGMADASVS